MQDNRFEAAYRARAGSKRPNHGLNGSLPVHRRTQNDSISSINSVDSDDFDFDEKLNELQQAAPTRGLRQFDRSMESPFDFMTTSTSLSSSQSSANGPPLPRSQGASLPPRSGSPFQAAPSTWNPSASLEAAPVPQLPESNSASTDQLMSYLTSLKRAPLAPRQPLLRSQSDFTTPATGSSSLNTSQNGSLYRATLNRQHGRSDSTTSNGSDDYPAPVPEPSVKHKKATTGLETVDLTHKKAHELPLVVIKELVGTVQRLALSYNRISKLPAEFAQLGTTLKYLNLRGNHMVVFPSVICQMASLEILDVSKNKIESMPRSCGTLKNLKVLSIKENAIRKLPPYFALMTELRVLKIDHNPIEWPPRDIAIYHDNRGPSSNFMERANSSESNLTSLSGVNAKEDEALAMQKWLGNLQAWMLANPQPDRRNASSSSHRTARPEQTLSSEEEQPRQKSSSSRPDDRKRIQKKPSNMKLSATRSNGIPSPLPSPSLAPMASPMLTPTSETPNRPPFTQSHSRNASATTSTAVNKSTPTSVAPLMRTKKSLPDLRLGQTAISPPPSAGISPSPSGLSSASVLASSRPSDTPSFDRPRPSLMEASTSQGKSGNRDSRAYFARLSMLPPSTSSKAVPEALLEFIDSIRGILFALSQIYSGLRQFAEHDHLPAALTKMMSTADVSMGRMINSLDRFDSTSRKWTSVPETATIREVFESCRANVSIFGKLVSVLSIQLKSLVGEADVRYTRTLLLMLYGSLGEIGTAWKKMAPKAAEVAAMVAERDAGLSGFTIHPPTPSPGTEAVTSFIPNSVSPKSTPAISPRGTPQALPDHPRNGRMRRHAGSFSVEDVHLGSTIAPASTSPITDTSPVESPISGLATSSSSHMHPARAPLSARLRPTAPTLGNMGNTHLPYMDILATLEGQPPTPMGAHPPQSLASPRTHSTRPSIEGPARVQPSSNLAPQGAPRSRQGSASRSVSSQAATIRGVDNDYLEMAESTTSKAFSVCHMLLETLTDYAQNLPPGAGRKHQDLTDLCEVTSEAARKLKASLDTVKDDAENAAASRRLNEDSHSFAQSVIQFALLARGLSQDLQFSRSVREGLSQLAKMTNSLLAMLSVTTFR